MEDEKKLAILERNNGWYGGYVKRNGQYAQVFNTRKEDLFFSIKCYTDKGYAIDCLDKSQEENFIKDRMTMEQAIEQAEDNNSMDIFARDLKPGDKVSCRGQKRYTVKNVEYKDMVYVTYDDGVGTCYFKDDRLSVVR